MGGRGGRNDTPSLRIPRNAILQEGRRTLNSSARSAEATQWSIPEREEDEQLHVAAPAQDRTVRIFGTLANRSRKERSCSVEPRGPAMVRRKARGPCGPHGSDGAAGTRAVHDRRRAFHMILARPIRRFLSHHLVSIFPSPRRPRPSRRDRAGPHHTCHPQPLPRLVFFMNPNRPPCRSRPSSSTQMAPRAEGKGPTSSTTEPARCPSRASPSFQRYGCHPLPTLLVTNASARRMPQTTPGSSPRPRSTSSCRTDIDAAFPPRASPSGRARERREWGPCSVLEKVFGVMVVVFGLLLIADVNPFKRITWVNRIQPRPGALVGLPARLTLGLV